MNAAYASRRPRGGFTLIELLVVIAIIGILAGIVVPNIVQFLGRGQVARAVAEIRNADTALTGMLSDTGRSRFVDFLTADARQDLRLVATAVSTPAGAVANYQTVQEIYNNFFYSLLRQGREAQFNSFTLDGNDIQLVLLPEVKNKLGTFYMDLRADPWGNEYNFWMGGRNVASYLRAFRAAPNPDNPENFYVYNDAAKGILDAELHGNPPADDLPGFPATRGLPVYIWSLGANQLNDAYLPIQQDNLDNGVLDPVFMGGGDDPNNWDSDAGWEDAPR